MRLTIYQVDAFTSKLFGGNPAAVCILDEWLPDETMQRVAGENNLSETAFAVANGKSYDLRWFTPEKEVDLCGHATLATAFVLFEIKKINTDEITFNSRSGVLTVRRNGTSFTLNFPADEIKDTDMPASLEKAIGASPVKTVMGKNVLMCEVASEKILASIKPDFKALARLHPHGVILTAKGDHTDFVSRCFFPNYGINEDPVTGSAHTILTPYWTGKLNKKILSARQISHRRGELSCEMKNDRVEITGKAVMYMTADIYLPDEAEDY
ncbi:MAG: PhzF family phenazine biosynthesis protein [Bacteroidia bacterium]|nr:PhzF family phenazine biosynthesis protein [Bacteroidia bacterium]